MKPVIIGAGLAGLTAALSLAPMPVILLSSKKLGSESSSAWAQGGIAAAVGADDTAELHATDTIKVGGDLCDATVVQQVTKDAAKVVENLIRQGAKFDRNVAGQLALGLEAAHSRRRIVHAGDATGAAIMQALVAVVRATPSIEVLEEATALDLAVSENAISGVTVSRSGKTDFIATNKVILATGGAGALWRHTTNPLGSWGQGLALAARAGAMLGDLEFMQFHPTAIDIGRDPMPLASEAVRGEGAILVDENGTQFIGSLQPRDIVARAIWQHRAKGHHTLLDARPVPNFAQRFPHIHALCLSADIDPSKNPIPVQPAAHYHMGGVVTDAQGRTNVKGLWACGEVANTGLHGANRLASNSLLEAAVFGQKVAEDILGLCSQLQERTNSSPLAGEARWGGAPLNNQLGLPMAPSPNPSREGRGTPSLLNPSETIRTIMSQHVGVLRDQAGLTTAIACLTPLVPSSDMALVALMIATAALRRTESRGAHTRMDYPTTAALSQRSTLMLSDIDLPEYKIGA